MTPEEIVDLKAYLINDLMYKAFFGDCNSCIPCSLCPIKRYYDAHDWKDKKDIFCCTDVVVKQKKEFQKWMTEQW